MWPVEAVKAGKLESCWENPALRASRSFQRNTGDYICRSYEDLPHESTRVGLEASVRLRQSLAGCLLHDVAEVIQFLQRRVEVG